MKLIAIRHGETEWNVQGREAGQLDSVLTERGIQQARLVAGRLNRAAFHALYSSDLGRAIQTAEIIPPNVRSRCRWTPGFEKGIWASSKASHWQRCARGSLRNSLNLNGVAPTMRFQAARVRDKGWKEVFES